MRARTALIIEDHENSSQALEKLLQHRKFQVDTQDTLVSGIKIFKETKEQGRMFNVIISDLALPDSKIDETLAILAGLNKECPVIALSGAADPRTIATAKELGLKIVLKGTSAEGIMEAILYELLEHQVIPPIEAAAEIIDNRAHAREIPLIHASTTLARLFASFPKWVQITTALGSFIAFGVTVTSGAEAIYNKVWAKGATSNEVATESHVIQAQLATLGKAGESRDTRLKILEDGKITVEGKIDNLSARVDEYKKDTNGRLESIYNAVLAKH